MNTTIRSWGVEISFDAKPSAAIRSALKYQGFRWSPAAQTWSAQRWTSAGVEAIENMERRERGERRPPDGTCWKCKAAPGWFRPFGAATPVYCDACHESAGVA
jgi:hypothetical protein